MDCSAKVRPLLRQSVAAGIGLLLTGCVTRSQESRRGVNLAALRDWTIVVADDALPSERYAAEEFQSHYARASGVTLPVTTNAPPGAERVVYIGPGTAMEASAAGFSTSTLGAEDLGIVVRDGLIVIAGGRPRGTLYGVYTFLEDYLGVRFLAPDHTYVPRLRGATAIGPIDRFYHPPVSYRYCYYGPNHHDHAFATRLRYNALTDDPRLGGQTPWQLINHSLSRYVPVRQYGRDHPDYFAWVDGRRWNEVPDDHYGGGGTQPCLTNPEVEKLVREGVDRDLTADPKRVNISVSQNDNRRYCRCNSCRAIDEQEGTAMGALLTFVNEVADRVAEKHPGVAVGTLAYQYSRTAPQQLRPRANVEIQLCSIEACLMHPINDPDCPANRQFCADLDAWSKICDRIFIWNYNTNFRNYLLPCPNLRVIAPNIRYFVDHHARGLFMQAAGGARSAELADLRNYLIGRLLWDPTQDEQVLMDEFLKLHYGRAAVPIRDYIALIHDNARQRGLHHHCFGNAADYGIDEAIVQRGLAFFEQAMRQADNEEVRRRVERASIPLHRAAIEPLALWWLAHGSKPASERPELPAELTAAMRPKVRQFLELCDRYEVNLVAETITLDQAKAMLREAFHLAPDELW